MEEERLQKYLANQGIASRRKAEEYILEGRVKVNNKIAVLGTKVNPDIDKVLFDDKKTVEFQLDQEKATLFGVLLQSYATHGVFPQLGLDNE